MSPVIEVSETTFRRLQEFATPFVDTPESVIIRALDRLGNPKGSGPSLPQSHFVGRGIPPGARVLNPESAAELFHTKILSAQFAGRRANNWNELLIQAHAEARNRLGSFSEVRKSSLSSLADGRREDSGFHFQSEIGFSIQYVDANKAWYQTLHIAKQLGVAVEVQFRWRDKEDAKHPGEFGIIQWTPENGQSRPSPGAR
jgi:hypothetical protein